MTALSLGNVDVPEYEKKITFKAQMACSHNVEYGKYDFDFLSSEKKFETE